MNKEIKIGDIIAVETLEERELDGEIVFSPYYREVKVINIFPIDKLGYEFQAESLGILKSRSYIRQEDIIEIININKIKGE